MGADRWAFLNPETGDWIEVRAGTVHPADDCDARRMAAVQEAARTFTDIARADAERAAPAGTPKDRQAPPSLGDGLRQALTTLHEAFKTAAPQYHNATCDPLSCYAAKALAAPDPDAERLARAMYAVDGWSEMTFDQLGSGTRSLWVEKAARIAAALASLPRDPAPTPDPD